MDKQVIQMIHKIERDELTELELTFLVQCIASYLNLRTISDTAKLRGKSFNGIKNFNKPVLIGGKKFIINRKNKTNDKQKEI